MAKEHRKEKEIHGHQLGAAGRIFHRGNLSHPGNHIGDTKKEKVNLVSSMNWIRNQENKK